MKTDREAGQQPLFVFGVYMWGAPVSSNQEVTVSGVADSSIRQATVARVRLSSSAPAYGGGLTPVANTPLKSLDYGLEELIPVNEYPGSLPERLPLLESAGPR